MTSVDDVLEWAGYVRKAWNIFCGTTAFVCLSLSIWKLYHNDSEGWQTWALLYLLLKAGIVDK